jgi:hypothetical protein
MLDCDAKASDVCGPKAVGISLHNPQDPPLVDLPTHKSLNVFELEIIFAIQVQFASIEVCQRLRCPICFPRSREKAVANIRDNRGDRRNGRVAGDLFDYRIELINPACDALLGSGPEGKGFVCLRHVISNGSAGMLSLVSPVNFFDKLLKTYGDEDANDDDADFTDEFTPAMEWLR